MTVNRYQVEFVGGPLDGHVQAIAVPVAELNESATFPINRNLFRLLARRSRGQAHPVTSVALYRLENHQGRVCYRFHGSFAPVPVG